MTSTEACALHNKRTLATHEFVILIGSPIQQEEWEECIRCCSRFENNGWKKEHLGQVGGYPSVLDLYIIIISLPEALSQLATRMGPCIDRGRRNTCCWCPSRMDQDHAALSIRDLQIGPSTTCSENILGKLITLITGSLVPSLIPIACSSPLIFMNSKKAGGGLGTRLNNRRLR